MKLYFAYGSNLCVRRFTNPKRVPSARFRCVARLEGHRVVFQKRSTDGSGKATIVRDPRSFVMGAVFVYDDAEHGRLKQAEAGYSEQRITIIATDGKKDVQTFVCPTEKLETALRPYDWYLELIRFGGAALGLPASYLSGFDDVDSIVDPDANRAAAEREYLK